MQVELRDYQQQTFNLAREAIRRGQKRILIVAPTGAGKTVIASSIMQMTVQKRNRANFVVDRNNLVQQTSAVFNHYGLAHGVIQSSHPLFRPYERIQICSAQTLARRGWPDAEVDVFDEAHVLHKTHIARMQSGQSIVIGLTATPFTKGLGKYFDEVINVTTTHQLIADGWLVPYRIFACVEPDMQGVAIKSSGEWVEKEASSRASKIVGDVVAEYQKHGQGRKFICSAVDVAHVRDLEARFLAAGVNVAAYTYQEYDEARAEVVREFRKPRSKIRGLITVTAASRGFDVPDVSCVIMARPLRNSLAEHIQLLGRGLRMAEGKKDCLVLDHSGNCERFFDACEGFFANGLQQLDDGKKRAVSKKKFKKKEVQPRKCPECHALHFPAKVCPNCGFEYPQREVVVHVPGTLKELLSRYGEGLKQGNANARKLATDLLWPQVVAYVLERREGEAARKMALAIFRQLTDAWPITDFYDTQPLPPSDEVRRKIRSQQIAHAMAWKTKQRQEAVSPSAGAWIVAAQPAMGARL